MKIFRLEPDKVKMNRGLCKLLMCLLLAAPASLCCAQTVVWAMQPSGYSDITRAGSNIFRVTKNGKIGLIYSDGTVAQDVEADEITDYYEGKALVIKTDGAGRRILGCLSSQGNYRQFPRGKKYYALKGQEFFSEDLLSVEDEDGRKGYINTDGIEVLAFGKGYKKIKPFSEGHAAVFQGDKYCLIDTQGNEAKFIFPKGRSGSEVFGGSNVYQGKAYIWDDEGRFYTYDVNAKGELVKAQRPNGDTFDYLYRLSCMTGETKKVPFMEMSAYEGKGGMLPTEENGLYGYRSGTYTVLPAQLTSADRFEDGVAVVGLYGSTGLLRLEPGTFKTSAPRNEITYHAGDTVTCSFYLSMPAVWRSRNAEISVKDDHGASVVFEKTSTPDSYQFVYLPDTASIHNYAVTVSGDGLKLYEATLTYTFTRKNVCPTCGQDIDACAYGGNHPAKKVNEIKNTLKQNEAAKSATKTETKKTEEKKERRFVHH